MNYYIQGSPDRAEEIKAAFKKLGYNTGNLEFTSSLLYYTIEGKVELMCPKSLQNLIKTHPDYKELELPIESCFKAGDWVVFNNNHNSIYQISKISDSYYMLTHTHGGSMPLSFSQVKFIRPWSIEDAKDGDVLVCYSKAKGSPIEQAGIFKQYVGRHGGCSNTFLAHTGIDWDGNIIINGYMGSANILPATKEQRDLLFAKMKEEGYEWDENKKELRKIKPHYGIKNFKPFDKVLVRDEDDGKWMAAFYSHYMYEEKDYPYQFATIGTDIYGQCVPFEGNEHLFRTTDMCDEQYINW